MARYAQQPQQGVGIAYTPHYDPGFFETAGNMLQQSQQQYDLATAAQAESMAQYGQEFSFNPQRRDAEIERYRQDLASIVEDYGGDVGAARNRLVQRMGKEATNPFWQANRYQVEQARLAQDAALRLGNNALWINDPRSPEALERALATGDMSSLETRVVEAPNYTQIAQQLGSTIKADLKHVGLSEAEIEGLLRHGTVGGISRDKLEQVANLMTQAFRVAAPNMAFENRQNYEWTQSDEGIVDFLLSNWAGLEHSQQKVSYMGDPTYQAPAGGGDGFGDMLGGRSRFTGANVEESTRKINKSYDKVSNAVDSLNKFRQDLSEGKTHDLNIPSNATDASRFVKGLNGQELHDLLETLYPGGVSPFIQRNSDTEMFEINQQYIREGGSDPVHAIDGIARDAANLGGQTISTQNRADRMERRVNEFIDENLAVQDLITELGFDRESIISNPTEFNRILDKVKEFEIQQAVQHHREIEVPSKEAEAGMLRMLRSSERGDIGRTEHTSTRRSGRERQRESRGGLDLIRSAKDSDIQSIELIPSVGEYKITVRDGNTTKRVYIPVTEPGLVSFGEEQTIQAGQVILENMRSLNTPLNELSEPIEVAGMYFTHAKLTDNDGNITPYLGVYMGGDPQNINSYKRVDTGFLGNHIFNAITMGSAYRADIRSQVIDSYRR